MIVVLDASVLIGHLEANDPLHAKATAIMEATAGHRRVAAALTRAEVLVGYARSVGEQQGCAALAALRVATVPALAGEDSAELAERAQAWASLVARARTRSGLKMPDAVVLATAEQVGGFVAALDDRLMRAARDEGRAFEPAMHTPEA